MKILFLGTDSCVPRAGNDTACFLINDELLVDVGWNTPSTMRNYGIDVCSIRHVLFTHLHHDHMMALPALLFCQTQISPEFDLSSLHLYGPCESLERAIDGALYFLQAEDYWPNRKAPNIFPLAQTDSFETQTLKVDAIPSFHAVPGRCYRIEEKSSKKVLCLTGDTAYSDTLAPFFKGCDLLIHEFSMGLRPSANLPWRHSNVMDAARVAKDADAKMLSLVHGSFEEWDACKKEVEKTYHGTMIEPKAQMTIEL